MGPGLWLSSLPLHSSEVPERHLSDLNWKDGEMHSERNLEREEIEETRQEWGRRMGGLIPSFCSDCAEGKRNVKGRLFCCINAGLLHTSLSDYMII